LLLRWEAMVDVVRSRVLLVDDHPLFRAGLGELLSLEPDLVIAGEAGTADEALSLLRREPMDVVIIEVPMPLGVALTTAVLATRACKVLALSARDEPFTIAEMLRAGACGYALKAQPRHEIVAAIRTVLAGERYLPPRVAVDEVLAHLDGGGETPLERLTLREREVFDLLIRGVTNDVIGERLVITRRTVETHRQRIMQKLSAHSLVDMIRFAARHGVLD
jgi:DNA-binding NarL/FixJ family response regulator